MSDKERLAQAALAAIDDTNQMLPPDAALDRSPDAVFVGDSGLDSMGLINFLTAFEMQIERHFQKRVSLIDIILAGERRSWTVGELVEQTELLVADGRRA